MDTRSADAIAEACARKMLEDDPVSSGLGIQFVTASAGRAVLAMTIRDDMINRFGTCHGGIIFTLADTALSCVCNSHNERSVAHHCSVIYLRPGQAGAALTATATERSLAGRVGIYDVTVSDADGAVVAEFFGQARFIGGSVLNPQPKA